MPVFTIDDISESGFRFYGPLPAKLEVGQAVCGRIALPEDVAYVLEHSEHCNGFYGASSMERLPTEVAITEHVRRYKNLGT